MLSQDDARLWVWQRGAEGFERVPKMIAGLDQSVDLKALGLSLPLSAIYGDLEFDD